MTVPLIVPVVSWANAGKCSSRSAISTNPRTRVGFTMGRSLHWATGWSQDDLNQTGPDLTTAESRRSMAAVRLIAAAAAVLVAAVLSVPVRTDEPISSSITYNREIYRIFESRCLACHASDGVAMPLGTYREAPPWARAIREELIEGRMPPWTAAAGYVPFANDIGLTSRELATILTWTDGGTPRGDDRDLPARAGGHRHSAAVGGDARLELPSQTVRAGEEY